MAGHRKFSELTAGWSPERKAAVARRAEVALAAMDLQEVAKGRGITQEELARKLDKPQGNVSRTLRRQDMHVSTLQEVVAAMGGKLEIVARFPDRGVRLAQFDQSPRSSIRKAATMAAGKSKNENTSPKVAKVAAKVLQKGTATPKQAKTLAGSALTQAKGKGGGKKK